MVSKAHIRSRPNGSIVGIASRGDLFEHVQDEDEWFRSIIASLGLLI